jgi:hypothetical protein
MAGTWRKQNENKLNTVTQLLARTGNGVLPQRSNVALSLREACSLAE